MENCIILFQAPPPRPRPHASKATPTGLLPQPPMGSSARKDNRTIKLDVDDPLPDDPFFTQTFGTEENNNKSKVAGFTPDPTNPINADTAKPAVSIDKQSDASPPLPDILPPPLPPDVSQNPPAPPPRPRPHASKATPTGLLPQPPMGSPARKDNQTIKLDVDDPLANDSFFTQPFGTEENNNNLKVDFSELCGAKLPLARGGFSGDDLFAVYDQGASSPFDFDKDQPDESVRFLSFSYSFLISFLSH